MKALPSVLVFASTLLGVQPALAATRQVGPGKAYSKPCAAFAASQPNDVIEIDAAGNATYAGDVCAVTVDGLTIRGVNGRAHIDAAGKNALGKGIWVVQGDDIVVENIEFSGAAVPDSNGAGIRAEGTNLTVRRCYFHDSQQGILGGAGEVLIESSEFAKNGNCIDPAGCAHNMYISNAVTKFTLRYCYSHDATDGHLVKSRAKENYILYNRLTGENGTASYELELPNAGTSVIVGNLIQQGPSTGNPTMLGYGFEGASNPGKDLYVVNNTFVNGRSAGGTFISIAGGVSVAAIVKNNIFVGTGTQVSQASAVRDHNFAGDPLLVNPSGFDYHLKPGSPCIDAGINPGTTTQGFSLSPGFEYAHVAGSVVRTLSGAIDIGAYERPTSGSGGVGGSGSGGVGGSGSGGVGGSGSGGVGGSAGGQNGGSAGTTATGGSGGSGSGGCTIRSGSRDILAAYAAFAALMTTFARLRRRSRNYH